MTDWCEVDDCPTQICNGPHASHEHDIGTVTGPVGDQCPFCSEVF